MNNTNRMFDSYSYNVHLTHTNTMSSDRTEPNQFHHNKDRNKHIIILLIAMIFMCKCYAVTGNIIEPLNCAGVVCNLECPSDSKVTQIFSYDPNSLSTQQASDVPHTPEMSMSKRKRAIQTRERELIQIVSSDASSSGEYIRHRRENNDSIAIKQCCECKCDFSKCPDLKCPPTEYKITISQGTQSPGSCCPKFTCSPQKPTCYSLNLQRNFNASEIWQDDPCTECQCSETGEMNCESSICKTLNCEKKHYIEGECCPVCDNSDSKFCEPEVECERYCRNGYEHDTVRNCTICVCAAVTQTTKKTTISHSTESNANGTIVVETTVGPSQWNPESGIGSGINTIPIDNSNASSTKPIGNDDNWYDHLSIVLVIFITIGAFAVVLSLTCRHYSHKKDKHHLNRHQDKPLI